MAGRKSDIGAPSGDLAPKFQAGLAHLAEAYHYAQDAGRDVWDFAVEIDSLSALGLTPSDLRWLVCKGYLRHACEITPPGEERRSFRPCGLLTFTRETCFVLTEAGTSIARSACDGSMVLAGSVVAAVASRDGDGRASSQVPIWDLVRRELRLGGRLVKQYKLPSRNQETILTAFQEEDWPPVIDDPLPPQPEQDPKRRLHDTVKSLNRHQKCRLIRFMGNGTGEGVRWELTPRRRSKSSV